MPLPIPGGKAQPLKPYVASQETGRAKLTVRSFQGEGGR
jgi:hypothetical protein